MRLVALARVVVDEADRREGEQPVALHLAHEQLAGVAGADDDHLLAARHDPAAGPLGSDRASSRVPATNASRSR